MGHRLKCIIVKHYTCDHDKEHEDEEAACLRYAHKVANDPDGYDGMIFCRWTADAIGKAIKLDWEKFV